MLKNFFKGQDQYGHPITLNLRGETSFTSILGGVLTLTANITMVGYTIFKFYGMINHKYNTVNHTEEAKSVE